VTPATPLPSSTVILLREQPDGFGVLMLERHHSVAFPGVHAFPGGVVDPGDREHADAILPPDQAWAPAGQGDGPVDALPYWVAAVREVFEEVGILLATRDGGPLEGPLDDVYQRLRARLHAGEPFARLLAESGLRATTDALYYLARWITPPANPRRFDTRFLVARLPRGQEACADGTETVSCTWMTPKGWLEAFEADEIRLIPPTIRTLDDLARFGSIDAVLAHARHRQIRVVRPEVDVEGRPTLAVPGGVLADGVPQRNLVLRDGRWRSV
jgi:8-oxo-dGTP pyrophosphatase MutT (NUDIX family)